jgi:hypothetical protein
MWWNYEYNQKQGLLSDIIRWVVGQFEWFLIPIRSHGPIVPSAENRQRSLA